MCTSKKEGKHSWKWIIVISTSVQLPLCGANFFTCQSTPVIFRRKNKKKREKKKNPLWNTKGQLWKINWVLPWAMSWMTCVPPCGLLICCCIFTKLLNLTIFMLVYCYLLVSTYVYDLCFEFWRTNICYCLLPASQNQFKTEKKRVWLVNDFCFLSLKKKTKIHT